MRITNTTNCQHHRTHITTTNLAKCAKMTEGEHRIIHGMNGVTDSQEDAPHTSTNNVENNTNNANASAYNLGGRLKFFKDGRFILELARAREGEKVAWVSVPKKTFWPPQGSASSLSTYRQESSASLSVSDDNSSVQSSPWQRDHTWKQSTPQRNKSTELNFYFFRKFTRKQKRNTCWLYRLQRSPYLIITDQIRTKCIPRKNINKCNNIKCVNSAIITTIKNKNSRLIEQIVQQLRNKTCQSVNSITSPRKRILREFERVTIEDNSINNKRCRGKKQTPTNNNTNATSSNFTKSPDLNGSNNSPSVLTTDDHFNQQHNQHKRVIVSASSPLTPISTIPSSVNNTPVTSKNCSYSITSLLGVKIESRDDKSSDQNLSSSHYAASATSRITHHDNNFTITSQNSTLNHAYAVDTVDSHTRNALSPPKRSPAPKPSPSPSSSPSHYPSAHYPPVSAHHHLPYMAPFSALYPSVLHHHHMAPPPYYAGSAAGYPGMRGPPTQGFYPPPMVPPIARHEAQATPYAPWVGPGLYEQVLHRDDSDVPLNLSKNAD